MKKIIISNNTLNGINLFREGLIKYLEKNYKVSVIADSEKMFNKNNYKLIDITIDRRGINPIKDILLLLNYIKILKKEKPDFVSHYTVKPNIYGGIACHILKIPYINTINGLGSAFFKENFIGRMVRMLYKISLKNSKKVFFQNKDDLNEFLRRNIVTKEQCIYVPGSGVDIKKFHEDSRKENQKIIFLFIGRLIKEKGIGIFCDVAETIKSKYRNVEFRIVGPITQDERDGISYEEIKKLETKKIIKYMGVSNDIRNEIKDVDCILFPSFYREGVPRSLLEAGAMAKAILTTNSVGCKDTVINGLNGYLMKPNDVPSAIEAVEKYLKLSSVEREIMGKNSRKKIIEEFDERKVFKIYQKIIKEII